jgi:hypothetical protein
MAATLEQELRRIVNSAPSPLGGHGGPSGTWERLGRQTEAQLLKSSLQKKLFLALPVKCKIKLSTFEAEDDLDLYG